MVKRLCLHACRLERLGGFFSGVSALRAAAPDARGSGFLTASSTCAAPCRWVPARRWFRLNAFLQRRLVGGVLHQIDIVEHGVPEQLRAQPQRVVVARDIDEREHLGGAAQRYAELVDGRSRALAREAPRWP